jgi:long-chain fatty acid transport protein
MFNSNSFNLLMTQMKRRKKIVIAVLLSAPYFLSAQGFQVNLQGQAQQAMGGAGNAFIQDGSAVFFNPGGMSFLKENSVSIGATATIANGTFLDADNNSSAKTVSPVSTPFTVYGVYGKQDGKLKDFKFGLGVYTPFGSIVTWENGWTGRFALTSLKLQAIFYQPTVSYKVCEKLGVGAGFVFATGNVELKQDLPVVDANGNYGKADLVGSANGYGFNAGVYYKPCPKFSVGLTYRSQVNMKVSNGTATFTVPPSLATNFPSGPFSSSLPLPSVLTLGLSDSLTSKLTLALDINYVGWKSYDTLRFDYKNNTSALQDTKLPRDYKNTFAFRLGAQYRVTDKITARAGLNLELTPIPSGYVTPELPDASRVNYAVGIGYKLSNHLVIDASYTYENFKRSDNNQALQLNGTYKTTISAPGLALTYKF